jgi:hypothetical protein
MVFLLFHLGSTGQTKVRFVVNLQQNDSAYTTNITGFKWYISHLQLVENNRVVWTEKNSYHLLDAFDTTSLTFTLPTPARLTYDHISFGLGIDSITNTSGILDGPLDPSTGMYWAWQSGYINLKLEGTDSRCLSPGGKFEFHLGGYSYPHNSYRELYIPAVSAETILIYVNPISLLNQIPLESSDHIMSPGPQAIHLSKKATTIFSTNQQ